MAGTPCFYRFVLEPNNFLEIEGKRTSAVNRRSEMNVAGFVGTTDEELIVRAMRDAQALLAEHIERGPFDAEQAITELMEIIDRQDIVAATNRLCNEFGLRPTRSR